MREREIRVCACELMACVFYKTYKVYTRVWLLYCYSYIKGRQVTPHHKSFYNVTSSYIKYNSSSATTILLAPGFLKYETP